MIDHHDNECGLGLAQVKIEGSLSVFLDGRYIAVPPVHDNDTQEISDLKKVCFYLYEELKKERATPWWKKLF